MAHRHGRQNFFIVGDGIYTGAPTGDPEQPVQRPANAIEEIRKFRFSRMHAKGERPSAKLLEKLALAMIGDPATASISAIPSGFTYLGQFIDHDLTLDKTAKSLGEDVSVEELIQGRSPALDLDCLYGRGPARDGQFYRDSVHLKTGTTSGVAFPADNPDVRVDRDGFDLPRIGTGTTARDRRQAQIPDFRNDENLVVAQVHAAFIRFHNRIVDDLAGCGHPQFEQARAEVVKHYQWMIRHDFLPRIVNAKILDHVFSYGRKRFEVEHPQTDHASAFVPLTGRRHAAASMPIEFSVAAYRFGHSMVRPAYEWNSVFSSVGPGGAATLQRLFNFSGTSGTLSPVPDPLPPPAALQPDDPDFGAFERLPTNWIPDLTRLFDFERDAGRSDLAAPAGTLNFARRIDTLLVDPLSALPERSVGGLQGSQPRALQLNLAFRNLTRGAMVGLPSGQQLADYFDVEHLTSAQLLEGKGGAQLRLDDVEKTELLTATPLWFYLLREAEVLGGQGGAPELGPLGSWIVAETFHRCMEASQHSIVRDRIWRPSRGPDRDTFNMVHLLLFAFDNDLRLLRPV